MNTFNILITAFGVFILAILLIGLWVKGGTSKDAYPAPKKVATSPYRIYTSPYPENPLRLMHFISEESEINVSSTLIMGEKEVVVVAAQGTRSSAERLASEIKKTGLHLTYVILEHAHLDHSQGAVVLQQHFPEAHFIAEPRVAALQQARMKADDEMARKRYGENAAVPSVPFEPYESDTLMLEGHEIQLLNGQFGDVGIGHDNEPHTVIYIPGLKALLPNDICYFGGHINMGGTTKESRAHWKNQIRQYMQMNLKVVIPGHIPRVYSHDMTADKVLSFSLKYIEDYEAALKKYTSSDEVIADLLKRYPKIKHTSALYLGTFINFKETHRLLFNPRLEKLFRLLPSGFVKWFNHKVFEKKKAEANPI